MRFPRATHLIVLVKSRQAGERVMQSLQRFLECNLKLKVNQEKSRVASTNQTTFLGFTFSGTRIYWSGKAFSEFKRRVKLLTGRSWFVSMDYRLRKLAEYLRGWMNYFGINRRTRINHMQILNRTLLKIITIMIKCQCKCGKCP